MLQLYKLRAALVAQLQEGCHYVGKGTEKIHQDVTGTGRLKYKERLNRLGLFTLDRRRLRDNLMEIYKVMKDIDKVNNYSLLSRIGESKTRGKV